MAKRQGRKYAAKRAIRMVRLDVKKHFRVPLENIRVAGEVNEAIWQNGSYNVPTRLHIEIVREKEIARVYLKGGKEKEAFLAKQKQKEREKKAEKAKEKEAPKTAEEKKEEIQEKEEQEKKLEEKRLKEDAAQKGEFK
jgi:ribosomal protein L31E